LAEAKKKYPTFTTPTGTFAYPKLNKPDFGTDKYPKKDGEYSVNMRFKEDDPVFQAFLATITPLHDQAVAEGTEAFKALKVDVRKKLGKMKVNPLYTEEYDQDTEQPTGYVKMKFAMPASGLRKKDKSPWTARPAVFDAKGKPLPLFVNAPGKPQHGSPRADAPQIWSGTEGKVSFEASGYFVESQGMAGLKLRLNAVQIINLVSGGQRSADAYGFGEEEGWGFEPQADDTLPGDSTTGDTTAPDDGNF
jgi:hypothetical protein